jgi:hypothetical protein
LVIVLSETKALIKTSNAPFCIIERLHLSLIRVGYIIFGVVLNTAKELVKTLFTLRNTIICPPNYTMQMHKTVLESVLKGELKFSLNYEQQKFPINCCSRRGIIFGSELPDIKVARNCNATSDKFSQDFRRVSFVNDSRLDRVTFITRT